MENLITLIFDIGLISLYLIITFIVAMLIQLIGYRIFNFNLYKFLKYVLVEREVR